MTSHEKKTPEEATLGAGAPGDPARTEAAPPAAVPRFLDVPVASEKTDIDTRPVTRIGGAIAGAGLVSVAITYGLFLLLGARAQREDPPPPPLPRAEGRQFPEPRLQTTPVQDFGSVFAQEEQFLNQAGFVDAERTVARIPIDHAITLVADSAASGRAVPMAPVVAGAPAPTPSAGPSPAPGEMP